MLKKLTKSGEYTHLLLIFAILAIYYFTNSVGFNASISYPYAAPIGNWIQKQVVDFPLLSKFVNILLMVLIASYMNTIGIKSEIIPRQSYITSSLLVAFMLFSPGESYFTSTLLIMLLLVFSYGNMMSIFGKQYPYMYVLNASMAIAVSSMILPHTILFIFFIWLGFFTYSVNSWREWIISIIGLIIPYIYMAFTFFWNDNLNYFIDIYSSFFSNPGIGFKIPSTYQLITIGLIAVLYSLSMLQFINDASDKVISIRKRMWLTFQFSFIGIIVMATGGNSIYMLLPVLYAPLALMLGYDIHNLKRSRVYDVMFALLFISILVNRILG